MKALLRAIVYVFLAIYNGIQVVTGGITLKKMAPTGVITSGILGGFSGKVGPVVGGKWKDIDYMRSYVIPANPNTSGQQAVRAKFAALVADARKLLANILQIYWDPFYSNMSGFNAWISQNYALANSAGLIDETALMSKGTLTGQEIDTATWSSGDVTITWNENTGGNALSTDSIIAIGFDNVSMEFYFSAAPVLRSAEAIHVVLPDSGDPGQTSVWIFAYRGTGSELVVSDSDGSAVS